jgi:hypothetical protein
MRQGGANCLWFEIFQVNIVTGPSKNMRVMRRWLYKLIQKKINTVIYLKGYTVVTVK